MRWPVFSRSRRKTDLQRAAAFHTRVDRALIRNGVPGPTAAHRFANCGMFRDVELEAMHGLGKAGVKYIRSRKWQVRV